MKYFVKVSGKASSWTHISELTKQLYHAAKPHTCHSCYTYYNTFTAFCCWILIPPLRLSETSPPLGSLPSPSQVELTLLSLVTLWPHTNHYDSPYHSPQPLCSLGHMPLSCWTAPTVWGESGLKRRQSLLFHSHTSQDWPSFLCYSCLPKLFLVSHGHIQVTQNRELRNESNSADTMYVVT